MALHDSSMSSETEDLIQRVHNLPPEIFNEVYNLTFTPEFKETCKIDKNYKPPGIIHVNKKYRTAFSSTFYRDTSFTVTDDPNDLLHMARWAASLTKGQLKMALKPRLVVISQKRIEVVKNFDSGKLSSGQFGRIRIRKYCREDLHWGTDEETVRSMRDAAFKALKSVGLQDVIVDRIYYRFRSSSCGPMVFTWR